MFETSTLIVIGVVTLIALGVGVTGTARVLTGKKRKSDDSNG